MTTTKNKNPVARALSWVFLVAAFVFFLLVGLIAYKGGEWDYIVSAKNPMPRLGGGVLCVMVWYFLRTGLRRSARQWAALAGKVALLALSLWFSLYMAEKLTRAYLRQSQGFGSIEQIQELEDGRDLRPRSSHALALLVRVVPNKMLVYDLRPGISKKFGGKHVVVNNDGMRDSHDYTPEPGPDVVRIVGIGDSGMFGWNVEQDEDYMAVLETNLNNRAGPWTYEVLNMGVPGYNTWQEIESLKWKGLKYRPDIVVMGWCKNDTDVPFFAYREKTFDEPDISYVYMFAFERKKFFEAIKPEVRKARDFDEEVVDEALLEKSGSSSIKEAFMELKRLSDEHGFRVLIFGPMSDTMERKCAKYGLEAYNTLTEIPEDKYPESYAVHFMHPRAPGHQVLAEHMEARLEKLGWLEPFPRSSQAD